MSAPRREDAPPLPEKHIRHRIARCIERLGILTASSPDIDEVTEEAAIIIRGLEQQVLTLEHDRGGARGSRDGWQPISSAPRDGRWLLLWWPFWAKSRPTLGHFGFRGVQQWFSIDTLEGDGDEPTHWMALPAAPGAETP